MITESCELLLHQYAYGLYTHGLFAKAATLFRTLTMLCPQKGGYWYGFASALFAAGQLDEAENIFEMATAYSPEDSKSRIYLAECQARLGKVEEAKNSLFIAKKLIRQHPDNALYDKIQLVEKMVER